MQRLEQVSISTASPRTRISTPLCSHFPHPEQEHGASVVTTTPTVTYILDFGQVRVCVCGGCGECGGYVGEE